MSWKKTLPAMIDQLIDGKEIAFNQFNKTTISKEERRKHPNS